MIARALLSLVVLLLGATVALGQPPTVTITANRCTVTLAAAPPDSAGGWRVQFLRDADVSVGNADTTPPYERTVTNIDAGDHRFFARWTRSGAATVTTPATVTTACELAEGPPDPTPCEVGWIDNWVTLSETACRPDGTKTITERRIAVLSPTGCAPVPDPIPSEQRDREGSCVYVPPSAGGVLAPSDLVYRGFARLPSPQLGGAAMLAGVTNAGGGASSLISMAGELAYEYGIPATPSRTYAAAPVAPLIRQVGYIYWNNVAGVPCDVVDSAGCWQDAENSYVYPSGERRLPLSIFNVHSLAWVGGRLWWTFLDFYNSIYGPTDHVIGVTDLAQTEKTGWAKPTYRVANSNAKLHGGSITVTPEGRLGLVGSFGAISRNTDNSHGPCWSEIAVPTGPGGFNSAALSATTTLCYSIGNKAPRAPDYIPDRSNPSNPDLEPVGGVGYWTQVDRCDVAVKIETTGGKRGLVFLCGFGTGQIWYGHYEAGPGGAVDPCRSSTRGENAQGYRPEWRIYDPQTLRPGHNNATHTFNPQTQFNVPYDDWWFPCKQYASGAFFDKPASRLYVLAAGVVHYIDIRP